MKITAELCRELGACYTNEELRKLFPKPKTPREVLTLKGGVWRSVNLHDRIWVLFNLKLLTVANIAEFLARLLESAMVRTEENNRTLRSLIPALRAQGVPPTKANLVSRLRYRRYIEYIETATSRAAAKLRHWNACMADNATNVVMRLTAQSAPFSHVWHLLEDCRLVAIEIANQQNIHDEEQKQMQDLLELVSEE